jgi:glycosyltransferase involved in cell wall biosynthesis
VADTLILVDVSAHNVEGFLGEALQSVSGKTWSHLEALVVDHESTDGTLLVAAARTERESRSPVFHHANYGDRRVAASRRLALREGRGSKVASIDADDLLLPRILASDVEGFKRLRGWGLSTQNRRVEVSSKPHRRERWSDR